MRAVNVTGKGSFLKVAELAYPLLLNPVSCVIGSKLEGEVFVWPIVPAGRQAVVGMNSQFGKVRYEEL